MNYEKKYLKYKKKFFKLKEQLGGASMPTARNIIYIDRRVPYYLRLLQKNLPKINPGERETEKEISGIGIGGYIITIIDSQGESLKKLVFINIDGQIQSVNIQGEVEKYSVEQKKDILFYKYKIGGIIYTLRNQAFDLDEFIATQEPLMTTESEKKSPFGFLLSSSVMYGDGTNYKFLHLKLNNQLFTTSKLNGNYMGYEKDYETQNSKYSITTVINIDEVLKLQKRNYDEYLKAIQIMKTNRRRAGT